MYMQSSLGAIEIVRDENTNGLYLIPVIDSQLSQIDYIFMNQILSGVVDMTLIDDLIGVIDEKPKLNLTKFNELSKHTELSNCSICFENSEDNIKLNCDHIYCNRCIKKWLTEKSNTCPTCRKEI